LVLLLSAIIATACGPATLEPTPPPTPGGGEEEVVILGPTAARDVALDYLTAAYGGEAPAAGLAWQEENTTVEGLVGSSSFQYTAEDWVVMVSFPVVAPQATIYQVVVGDEATGFRWEGEVNAQGQVTELAEPQAQQGTPSPVMPSEVTADELAELVEGNSAFAFDLYQVLKERDGNLFYSPHSISLALAMTYAGARGETETQMAETLRFLLSQERLHPAFRYLDGELASRGKGAAGRDGEGFRLNIANAIWGQEGYQFLAEFLDVLAANYGAGLRPVDFMGAPEKARETINDWVSEETEGRIEDVIPPGLIDALTRLVLTNAIYFNAAWAEPFEEEQTEDGPFYLLDGGQITIPMMRQGASLAYAEGQGYQAVELPYSGWELSMLILLPQEGGFEQFQDTLDAVRVQGILQELGHTQVALKLPRFEFESSFNLRETLAEMGMVDAFTGAADFSGMTGNRELFISEVIHKAFVAVDEEGTEAAAATVVMMPLSAAPGEPTEMTVDRPFLFLIRDVETGSILFVGRVLDPSS
jgi:serpin B